jgi:hypothetical protein
VESFQQHSQRKENVLLLVQLVNSSIQLLQLVKIVVQIVSHVGILSCAMHARVSKNFINSTLITLLASHGANQMNTEKIHLQELAKHAMHLATHVLDQPSKNVEVMIVLPHTKN